MTENKNNSSNDKIQKKVKTIEENIELIKTKPDPNLIHKNIFLNDSNKNLAYITKDTQDTIWESNHTIRNRSLHLEYVLRNFDAYRCCEMSEKEYNEKKLYEKAKIYDIMYQFNKFIKIGTTHICHFQVRKNLLKNSQFLIYNKKYSLECYDTIKNKPQTLINFENNENDGIICFDVFHNKSENFLACLGRMNGNCDLFTIKQKDFYDNLNNKNFNITPKFIKNFSLLTSELNNDRINNSEEYLEAENYINYLKFIDNNKLISTSNDCNFKINDLVNKKVIQKYKNDTPINHCDINNIKTTLLTVGDTKNINIIDLRDNKKFCTLSEHYDYGIVIKFNPYNNVYFASGNQDLGCKIWDIRKLDKGSILTSWGRYDSIGDLDWIDAGKLCYMENAFCSHIFDIKNNKLQDLFYYGKGNGVVHDKLNDNVYLNLVLEEKGGIFCYDSVKNKVFNSFNNMEL